MKEPIPHLDINWTDLGTSLTAEQMAKTVPGDPYYWECCVEGCGRRTRAIFYGNWPWIIWRKKWVNTEQEVFFCGRHYKQYRDKTLDHSTCTHETPKPDKPYWLEDQEKDNEGNYLARHYEIMNRDDPGWSFRANKIENPTDNLKINKKLKPKNYD